MTSRSIVLSTAALLLLSAVAPAPFGFSPTAVFAQKVSAEVAAALSGQPAQFQPKELRERIKVLRDAVQSGALKGSDKKAAQQKIKAYREVLEQHKDVKQATQKAEQRKSERQAEKKEQRQAEKQAQRQAEKKEQRQAEKQAQREAEKKEQRQAEKKEQRQAEKQAQEKSASQAQRRAEKQAQREAEQQAQRQAERRAQRQAEKQAQEKSARQAEQRVQKREQQPEATRSREASSAEVNQKARAILADNTPASRLDDKALRNRLKENRAVLATGKLSRAEERQLREQLRGDRDELRGRVASSQERTRGRESRSRTSPREDAGRRAETPTNVADILEKRTPSDRLTERELEHRVRVLSKALKDGKITLRQAEIAELLIEHDRNELSRRLHAGRDYRRQERRQARSRNEVFIDFHVGYQPPPVIFAAEAMPRDIEVQLIAPPLRQMTRSYTVQEISLNHDVRETMPGIEIDTLNFDFGSAEVRPEEIDKLDDIAEVIERIVAARPDEVFLIEGHTDAVGSDAANDALSQRRAHAVMEALTYYYDIEPANLKTVGLGKRFLKIWTPDPEEENRRVTVRRITPLLAGGQG